MMNEQKQLQAEADEISLSDILFFLKVSGYNIIKCTLVSLLAGCVYFFSDPKIYEASVTIEMAMVAGEPVESPAALLEKIKLPLYFSTEVLQACGSDNRLSSQAKFVDKIKPSINKSAPFLTFVTQAPSSEEAKACLNAVTAHISNKQDEAAQISIFRHEQKIQRLKEQSKLTEKISNNLPFLVERNASDALILNGLVGKYIGLLKNIEIQNDLQLRIIDLENDLVPPKTRATALASTVYSPEVSVNNRPLFTLGFCLSFGVFFGLLVTAVQRMSPKILR